MGSATTSSTATCGGAPQSLGADVDPSVVVSAFGVFAPELLVPIYQHARTISTREQILDARADRRELQVFERRPLDVSESDIGEAGDLLIEAVALGRTRARGRCSPHSSRLPVPDDPFGRLWRGAELVREHRGDTHLAACACAGLGRAEMNVFTELWLGYAVGEYSSTRGLGADALGIGGDPLCAIEAGSTTPVSLTARRS